MLVGRIMKLAKPKQENEGGETPHALDPKDVGDDCLSLAKGAIYALCRHVVCSEKP